MKFAAVHSGIQNNCQLDNGFTEMIQRLIECVLLSSGGHEPGKGARVKVVDCEDE